MNSSLEKWYLKIVKTGIVLALFTPLILGPFGLTFSSYPKAVFFRTIIEITFIFYLLLILKNPRYILKLSPLIIAVIVFLTLLFLSSLSGINFYRSFFGEFERNEGLILYLHLFVFLVILTSVYKKKEDWLFLLKTIVIVGSISSLAALCQKFKIFLFYGIDVSSRVSGTLANPDFFGGYIMMIFFLVIFILSLKRNKNWQIFWGIILALNFLTLILSRTRSGWAGTIAGLLFFFFLWFFFYSDSKPKLRKIIAFTALAFVVLALFVCLNQDLHLFENNDFFNRISSLVNVSSISARYLLWEVAFKSWLDKPMLGWGLESFNYVFDKYFEASRHISYLGSVFYDRPHNKIMEVLSANGILGLLSYLSVFAFLFYLIFRYKNNSLIIENNTNAVWLAAFLTAYLVQLFFAFDTISTYIIFFLIIGFVNNNFKKEEARESTFVKRGILTKILIYSLIFIALTAFYSLNFKTTLASVILIEGFKSNVNYFPKALSCYLKVLDMNSIYEKDFRREITMRLVLDLEEGRKPNVEKQIIDTLSDLKPYLKKELDEKDIKNRNVYELVARIDERTYLFSKDEKYLVDMEEILNKALEFNNQRMSFYELLGAVEIYRKNYNKGEEFFNQAFELSSKTTEDKVNYFRHLGVAYVKAEDYQKAADNFKKAIDIKYVLFKKFNQKIYSEREAYFMEQTALLYFNELNDLKTAKEIYQKTMDIYPEYKEILENHLKNLEEQVK
ncbi:MAG: O-antigen ligase family protein [Candidatus Pacebacteria bacterium]|nr:O-antigen ligase family protein [Candidatus Paceibacterota bacterium]